MPTGAITAYIDVAQVVLYAFWIFFAGLIYYLLRENKREGFPLDPTRRDGGAGRGWPSVPSPKSYVLQDGTTVTAPRVERTAQTLNAVPDERWPGAPLVPTGNPLLAGVGPGAWNDRADVADVTAEGDYRIVPLRVLPGYDVARQDTDPRGLQVLGADGAVAGTVADIWVDRSDVMFRYLEVRLATGRNVLVPVPFARIGDRAVRVRSILSSQFADVPGLRVADTITRLEEERIVAYYGAGTLYATPTRQEPLL
ncbi:photosynthetic reaction center subunit H [Ramlibacter sp.]|uniref:photosynthetic reaction center subunit H n=1 Tax=Ramlibacter sp. TaxID=1917967 RepID=UPI003D0E11AF